METEQTGTRRKLISVMEDVEIVSKWANSSIHVVLLLRVYCYV